MRTTGTAAAAAAACALALGASAANAGVLHYEARLSGAAEAPANPSQARGLVTAVVDTDRRVMEYTVTYSGLGGPVSVAGFKEDSTPPDDPIVTAPTDGKAKTIHAVVSLTDAQINALDRGKWLFDIATTASPGGEIRGRLHRVSGD
jgi:hypothetical protein